MSYKDYKKMMIEDIRNDPEWWFDLIELKNKDIKELMSAASKKIPEELIDIIHNHYYSLLDELQDMLDFQESSSINISKPRFVPRSKSKLPNSTLIEEYVPASDLMEQAYSIPQLFKDEVAAITKMAEHNSGKNSKEILSKTQYKVYDLLTVGKKPKEIAQILGKDKSGISKIIKRIAEKMKKAVDDETAPKMATIKKKLSRL